MEIHKIKRQKLLSEPFSKDALKLARALYNTYKNNGDDLYMEIKLKTVVSLLGLRSGKEAVEYIETLLEELNEPIAVKNFKLFAKVYPIRFVVFCKYRINDDIIKIELSEEYLEVESKYMLDSFLSHQD